MSQPFDNRDYDAAEIVQLKKELAYQTDMAAQADMFVNRYKSLITELADALEDQTNIGFGKEAQVLIQKAREAVK